MLLQGFSKTLRRFQLKQSLKHNVKMLFGTSNRPSSQKTENLQFNTVVELLQQACALYKDKPALGTATKDSYQWMTYGELGLEVQKFRNILLHHNIGSNDKVAVISNNRVEFAVCLYAIQSVGAQIVPMLESQLERTWQFILEDSGARMLIVSTEPIFKQVKDYVWMRGVPGCTQIGNLQSVLVLDTPVDPSLYPHCYDRWMKLVESEAPSSSVSDLSPEHLSTVIYTSGTTGKPKGVELCHRNITSGIYGAKEIAGYHLSDLTSLAFLPWAHIFGMTAELHTMLSTGSKIAIVPHSHDVSRCMQLARPDLIRTVPLFLSQVHSNMLGAIDHMARPQRAATHWALGVARHRNHTMEFGKPVGGWLALQHKLADKIVLSKLRAKLGGNLKFMISGGAATSTPVLEFFEDIGIPVLEGYGLTETSSALTSSGLDWEHRRLGCVGVPLPGVTVRIVDPHSLQELPPDTDGEITCSGPNVMVGYRNSPQANAEAFYHADNKRFFRTGDLGRMVKGKFLKITGRIKEQFKLENGKYVVPAPMEDVFCRSPLISQIFIYGQDKPHTVALVVPDWKQVRSAMSERVSPSELEELMPADDCCNLRTESTAQKLFLHSEFKRLVSAELVRAGVDMDPHARPAVWTAISSPFSERNQQLTHHGSLLRRGKIAQQYASLLEHMYCAAQGHVHNGEMGSCVLLYEPLGLDEFC